MTRAERRRQERQAAKGKRSVPVNVFNYSSEQLAKELGIEREKYLAFRESLIKEIRKDIADEMLKNNQERILKAQDYLTVGNLMISLVAINATWGFKNAMQRFVDNYMPATEYVMKTGIDEVYKIIHEQTGITIEFDSVDLNKEYKLGEYADDSFN